MNKFIYMNEDGIVSVVIPAPKAAIERVMGKLTNAQYKAHVIKRSLTDQGITEYREILDSDLPADREFRNAWVDVTPESKVDICCTKAKEIGLGKLRAARDKKLVANDEAYLKKQKDQSPQAEVLAERQALLTATDPLKALDVAGKVNDEDILEQIRTLSKLN